MASKITWSDELVEELREIFESGKNPPEAAAILSDRHGIKMTAASARSAALRNNIETHCRHNFLRPRIPPSTENLEQIVEIPDGEMFAPSQVVDGCRYIFGEIGPAGSWHYCQKHRKLGSSYCEEHHSVCWVKPKPYSEDDPIWEK